MTTNDKPYCPDCGSHSSLITIDNNGSFHSCGFCGSGMTNDDYKKAINNKLTSLRVATAMCSQPARQDIDNPTSEHHINWMIDQCKSGDIKGLKLDRWVGYILGWASMKNISDCQYIHKDPELVFSIPAYRDIAKNYLKLTENNDEISRLCYNLSKGGFDSYISSKWLGYLQAKLALLQLINIKDEADKYRDTLSGN